MEQVWTKQGGTSGPNGGADPPRANRLGGDIELVDHHGRRCVLRPTFEAALEIEEALGTGLEGLRTRLATTGLPGMPAPTTRELGVILAAGVRASGDPRVTPEGAARYVYDAGRERLRKPLLEFVWALTDGGRLREEDLKKRGSSTSSPELPDADEATTEDLIGRLSGSISG